MRLGVIICCMLCVCASVVEAKYKYPAGARTTMERKVTREMKIYDNDGQEGLSKDEFVATRKVITRDDRRMERRAKKQGTYQTPEEEFAKIDVNGDGIISNEELLQYRRNQQ